MKKTLLILIYSILAVICFIYSVIILSVGSGTGFFAVWIFIGMIFVACDFMTIFNLWRRLPTIFKRIGLIFLAIFFTSFVIIEGFIISGFFVKEQANLDYIVVLGAQVYKDRPSVILKYRLDRAVKYLNENENTKCIVCGGQGHNEPFAEAIGMKKYLIEQGISEFKIIMDTESQNTEQNIQNSLKHIDSGASVGVVTNNFHVFRALQIARKNGLDNVCGLVAGMNTLYLPNNMVREFFSEIKFLVS